jgi:hypothetical protein
LDKEYCRLKEERDIIKEKIREIQEKSEKINNMNSTFKTELGKSEKKYIKEKEKEEKELEVELEDINSEKTDGSFTTKNKNSKFHFNENKETKKGYFNMDNINKVNHIKKINNFNSKGINIHNFLTENHLYPNVNKIQISNLNKYLTSMDKSKSIYNNVFNDFIQIDKNLAIIKKNISNLKLNEMNRLIKEFNSNEYERRFKTTRFTVISALIGEEHVNLEISRQIRENKVNNNIYFFPINLNSKFLILN